MINEVTLVGRIGRDPELRYTQQQNPVCTFSVATTEYQRDKNEEHVEWHNVIVWGKNGENASKYLKKGSLVLVKGKLRTRKWEDKNAVTRYSTEIIAFITKYLDQKSANQAGDKPSQGEDNTGNWDNIPL